MPRQKGTPKTGGRQKGTPNKTTATVKSYITDALELYMRPQPKGSKDPNLWADLVQMLPEDRVRAMTQLAGYVVPKQQALSVEEQTKVEEDALTRWLETAPDDAIEAIAAKLLEIQKANTESNTNEHYN